MLYGEFTRGTTPTHTFPLPKDLKLSDFNDLTITYCQKGKSIFIKKKIDVCENIDGDNHYITLNLSQIETFMFNPHIKIVAVQIKGRTNDGNVLTLGEYRFRLNDFLGETEAVIITEKNEKEVTPQLLKQANDLMYRYASLCNDILKECQRIRQEIEEVKKND